MATSTTWKGVTWTWDTDKTVHTFADGSPYLVGAFTITNISPKPSDYTPVGLERLHGSMKNPVPMQNWGFANLLMASGASSAVFEGKTYEAALNVALSLPLAMASGDVIVSSVGQYLSALDIVHIERNLIKSYATLYCMPEVLPTGTFRPSFYGTDRTTYGKISDLQMSKIPNHSAPSSIPTVEAIFGFTTNHLYLDWLDHADNGGLTAMDQRATNSADASLAPSSYGRELAFARSIVTLSLCTDRLSSAQKLEIAINEVQRGLDVMGFVENGGSYLPNGGHKYGRESMPLLAALLLENATVMAFAKTAYSSERLSTFFVPERYVGFTGRGVTPYLEADIGMPDWGIRHSWEPSQDTKDLDSSYRDIIAYSFGTAVAFRLMTGGMSLAGPNAAAFYYYAERMLPSSMFHPSWGDMATLLSALPDYALTYPRFSIRQLTVVEGGRTLTITCDAGPPVYYTTDGSYPVSTNPSAFIYSAPFTPSSQVRSVCYAGGLASLEREATYTIIANGTPTPPTNLQFIP